jgi:heat shock protein HslJ
MNKIFIALLAAFTFASCTKSADCTATPNEDCVCITLYDPVCGCNNVTYGNACEAGCAGISDVTEGRCIYDIKPLIGKWTFLGYESEGAKMQSDKKTHKYDMYLTFEEEAVDGRFKLSGKSAINFMLGDYEIANLNQLNLSTALSTKIAGPEPDLSYEYNFVNYLIGDNAYTIDGDYLKIGSEFTPTPTGPERNEEVMIFRKD